MEKEKLKQMRKYIEILEGMIKHTKNITALKVFNVEILRQSSTSRHRSKETIFGWHIDNEEKKIQAKPTVVILLSNTTSLMKIMTKSDYD